MKLLIIAAATILLFGYAAGLIRIIHRDPAPAPSAAFAPGRWMMPDGSKPTPERSCVVPNTRAEETGDRSLMGAPFCRCIGELRDITGDFDPRTDWERRTFTGQRVVCARIRR